MEKYLEYLEFAQHIAQEAGQVLHQNVHGSFDTRSKGLRDLVTSADLEAEACIVRAIRSRYPKHDILTEESPAQQRRSPYQWVIDPLDGTGNFSRRFPCFSTSIGLTLDDEPIAGVVYDPMRQHLFSAARGAGATLNGQPLHVSKTQHMIDTLIGLDWTRDEDIRRKIVQAIARLTPECGATRNYGSAALGLCYVAAGWWDAYFHLHLYSWDAAAGALIVREAGGVVTDGRGARWQPGMAQCLTSNGRVHERFCELVHQE